MKIFSILFLSFFLQLNSMAQKMDSSYKKEWLEIDKLISKENATKSALKKVDVIYKKAKTDNKNAQLIKALIYKMELSGHINEDAQLDDINLLQKEIETTANTASKSILQLLLAKEYNNYFNNYSYQINQRTLTNDKKKNDITVWSKDDFTKQIFGLYNKSIEAAEVLQKTKLEDFDVLIMYGEHKKLRPTLYDVLVQEALEYFTTYNENNYGYYRGNYVSSKKLTNASVLEISSSFMDTKFKPIKEFDAEIQALQLFQSLMAYHKKSKNIDAFIDVDIQRINWVYENIACNNKEQLYLKALHDITNQFSNNIYATQAWYLQAKFYSDKAATYVAHTKTNNRYDYVKAIEIIQARLKINSDSCEGNINMKNLLKSINKIEFSTKLETVNVPNQPFRMLVNFKNISSINYRIIKLKTSIDNSFNDADNEDDFSNDDKFWTKIVKKNYVKQVAQNLPSTKDYQQHSCEVKVDALPAGSYAILVCNNSTFNAKEDKFSYITFAVSSLSLIENGSDIFIVDRDNGKPINAATIKVYTKNWNSEKQKYYTTELGKSTSNENGYVSLRKLGVKEQYGLTYVITKANDTLINGGNNVYESINSFEDKRTDNQIEADNTQVHFYLDRSIYRPSQTVFFKGIVTTKSKDALEHKLFLNMPKTKVYLRDVDGKNIDTLDVQLNEYGSFNGKFVLPKSALTGNFGIITSDGRGYINFSVEEYKRPKFYVEYEKQKATFKLNDIIKSIGFAKAYAGNVIDGAKVSYTVTRKTRFENTWCFWRMPRPNSEDKQIAVGEAKTDAQGKFTINFNAAEDESVDKSTNPIFDFEINASVTDINGETREAKETISIGYQSLVLKIDMPETIDAKAFQKIKLSATNLAGESVDAKVDIKIAALQTPTRLLRNRFWSRPDTFILSEKEYINNFPYDEYDNETDRLNWKERNVLLADTTSLSKDVRFTMYDLRLNKTQSNSPSNSSPLERLGEAQYLITISSNDKDGNLVEAKHFIEVINGVQDKSNTYPRYIFNQNKNNEIKEGDTASIKFSTSATEIYLIKNIVTANNKLNETYYKSDYSFSKENSNVQFLKKSESFATKGFGMFYAFVKNNRIYKGDAQVYLVKPKKELQISYATFRNKALPGSQETYSLKIAGLNDAKADAELLTSMYDASLDQYKPHNWYKPNFDEYENYSCNFNFEINEKGSFEKYFNEEFENFDNFYKHNKLAQNIDLLKDYNGFFIFDKKLKTYKWNASSLLQGKVAGVSVLGNKGAISNTLYFAASANVSSTDSEAGFYRGNDARTRSKRDFKSAQEKREEDMDGISDQFDLDPNSTKATSPKTPQPQIRKNFNEIAFFFPNVYANEKGEYTFNFTIPEALTKWKMLSLAHTKNLEFGLSENTVVTAKPLMVQPNIPRFLRDGDLMELTAKIANTTDKEITGTATLELIDASTGKQVDGLFNNVMPQQFFTASAGQSSLVKFPIQVPANFSKPLSIRIVAFEKNPDAGPGGIGFSDGEETTIPVLTNKIFLTESLPIYLRAKDATKTIDLSPLFSTATNRSGESMTIEYTSNPVWSVVQAIPYLMEFPYECAEQTFNRFFANAMAASIVKHNPNIQNVINAWKKDTSTIASKLQLNEELKNIVLAETPWVLEAESEVEQQKRLALLLDLDKMQSNMDAIIEKIKSKQLSNGAFSWFDGGRENEYITQYIITGFGKLQLLNILNDNQQNQVNEMIAKGLLYLDSRAEADYKEYLKSKKKNSKTFCYVNNSLSINYWFMRSMFTNIKLSATLQKAKAEFINEVTKNGLKDGIYNQAMMAIIMNRFGEVTKPFAKKLINSLKENAVENEEKGTMYWKQNDYAYYWYQNNIETQALLIQAFAEMNNSDTCIEKMKTWLLLNKQTNRWNSTISTSAACYAIMSYGGNPTLIVNNVSLNLADKKYEVSNQTGDYLKTKVDEVTLNKLLATKESKVVVQQSNKLKGDLNFITPSYGAVYFQYFADVNDVQSSTQKAPLTLVKKLYIEKNNGTKKVLEPIEDNAEVKVGDKLIVRVELRCDRSMEFLHLKDMRAANTEPVNVISSYKWQDGLGYYESTKDASTNFFIDNIQRGTYVFEYPLFVTHAGTYSVGLASIQCMYAPEFTSHSNGIKIRVSE